LDCPRPPTPLVAFEPYAGQRRGCSSNASDAGVSDYLVEVRGFIHHHTMRRRGIWHPERQEEFEFDAFVLQHIAFGIAMKMMLGETHKEELDVASIKVLKRVS
jgi:hypothetical protein